jgi:AcrR family transcriptional regulator
VDRAGLTPRAAAIVAAAGELLDAEGPEALSMRRLAERTGLRASSLYRHVSGKEEIEAALIAEALELAADVFAAAAAEAPDDPLPAILRAYRRIALAHPHRYRLMTERPLPRTPAVASANERAAAPLVAAVDGDPDRARAAWAFAHGMAHLELSQRFPPGADLDAAWAAGAAALGGRAGGRR